jgi:hypothetical protein
MQLRAKSSIRSGRNISTTTKPTSPARLQLRLWSAPEDEIEGMIAAQMVACHNASMECYRRAMLPDNSFDMRHGNLNSANKLSRTFAALVEGLNRHRGKGQQKVTVEHVHVHEGGQAVVGSVESPGGGFAPKSKEQPHALAHAPSAAMPGAIEAEWEAVPVAGGQR